MNRVGVEVPPPWIRSGCGKLWRIACLKEGVVTGHDGQSEQFSWNCRDPREERQHVCEKEKSHCPVQDRLLYPFGRWPRNGSLVAARAGSVQAVVGSSILIIERSRVLKRSLADLNPSLLYCVLLPERDRLMRNAKSCVHDFRVPRPSNLERKSPPE
jgi:hypothetical protein